MSKWHAPHTQLPTSHFASSFPPSTPPIFYSHLPLLPPSSPSSFSSTALISGSGFTCSWLVTNDVIIAAPLRWFFDSIDFQFEPCVNVKKKAKWIPGKGKSGKVSLNNVDSYIFWLSLRITRKICLISNILVYSIYFRYKFGSLFYDHKGSHRHFWSVQPSTILRSKGDTMIEGLT